MKLWGPVKIIVFVCDTVACCNDSEFKCYSDVEKVVREKYKSFMKKYVIGESVDEKIVVHVLPCFGSFPNGRFVTDPLDTYTMMLYGLYKEVSHVIDELGEDDEIRLVADLTHGVNYMPAFPLQGGKGCC